MSRLRSLAFLSLLAGCAQPPTKELAITAERIEAAREQDAAVFAPELFAEAERSFAEANRLAELERDYLGAIQAAAHSTLRANEAFSRASIERTASGRQLDRLLLELGSLLEIAAARGATERAPTELAAFQTRYDGIRAMVEEHHLPDALAAGTALKLALIAFEERLRAK